MKVRTYLPLRTLAGAAPTLVLLLTASPSCARHPEPPSSRYIKAESQAPEAAHTKQASLKSDIPVVQSKPAKYQFYPAKLPAPYGTNSAQNGPEVIERPPNAALHVPPGFTVRTWASDLINPRVLVTAPNGDIFVAESRANRVTILRDADGDGTPETRSHFATGLSQPFGIAFYPPGPQPKYVYVANTDSVVRFPYKNGDLKTTGPSETLVNDLPGGGYRQHWTRRLVFRPDGKKMYVSVGSRSNASPEEEKRAAILEYNPDGTGYRVYASGLRNAVGLAFNPITGKLWAAVNERDGLGDDLVPDFVTSIKPGGFYGWPYYYIGKNHDPRLPEKPELKARSLVPDVLLQSHTAALSVQFYSGKQFPGEYRSDAFVGLHGSWNRTNRVGYEIIRVPMNPDGTAKGYYEDFVWGWKLPDDRVWGRPVDITFARDGSMLLTDDGAGKIWEVSYTGKR